jgi:hypothetical protein
MPNGDLISIGRDLNTFLRRVLSGYVYLTLTAPLWLSWIKEITPVKDFIPDLALLVVVGIVVGSLIYNVYHFFFGCLHGIVKLLVGLALLIKSKD